LQERQEPNIIAGGSILVGSRLYLQILEQGNDKYSSLLPFRNNYDHKKFILQAPDVVIEGLFGSGFIH
jgi:hypothetical protein